MKLTNTLRQAFIRQASSNDDGALFSKSDNFFHNSLNRLFQGKKHQVVKNEVAQIDNIEISDRLMSDDDFLKLLPANGYFH